jgi:membrane-associated phospholipid phosphatase
MMTSAALALGLLAPSVSRADDSTAHQLRYNLGYDLAVIAGSTVLVASSEYFKLVKPQHCRWCDRTDQGDQLNGTDAWARRTFLWKNPQAAQFDSGVTAFLLEPAATALEMVLAGVNDKAARAFPVDFLVISEAVAVSTLLNQTTKILFARERPFVHALEDDKERQKTTLPSDNNVSFYSGHTTLSFTLATAAGTVATLRGYRLMPLVWATLMPLAATTGYLRIAADKHYLSDVLTGAVLGSAVGALLPILFHNRESGEFVPNGLGTGNGAGTASSQAITTMSRALPAHPQMVTLGGGF